MLNNSKSACTATISLVKSDKSTNVANDVTLSKYISVKSDKIEIDQSKYTGGDIVLYFRAENPYGVGVMKEVKI